jgi:hypothetical protein
MPEDKSSRPTDRNLLFGILALQMDFSDRDALITAMHAWMLAKHQSLGDILVQQGKLPVKGKGSTLHFPLPLLADRMSLGIMFSSPKFHRRPVLSEGLRIVLDRVNRTVPTYRSASHE